MPYRVLSAMCVTAVAVVALFVVPCTVVASIEAGPQRSGTPPQQQPETPLPTCAGEYQQCAGTGECVLDAARCGKCAPGSFQRGWYQCPTNATVCVPSLVAAPPAAAPACNVAGTFWDTALPLSTRVALVVANLTVTEAIAQMTSQAPSVPRLNVPSYNWLNDDLHGLRRHRATSFPNGCGLGAAWDNETAHKVGAAIADEARSLHHWFTQRGERGATGYANGLGMTIYGPNINLVKDPRWGRNQEVYSEDPCLTGELAKSLVRGMQEVPKTPSSSSSASSEEQFPLKAAACCKHLAVYDIENNPTGRKEYDANVDGLNLWETYMPAFEACVREAKAAHVMCSYNSINGVPACAQRPIIEGVMRQRWGFQGFVVSDYDAWAEIMTTHHYCPNMTCAAATGVNAGMDQEGTGQAKDASAIQHLAAALSLGLVTEQQIRASVTRLFTVRFRLGMFDPPSQEQFGNVSYAVISDRADVQLALDAAKASMTLHWNTNETLPFSAAEAPPSPPSTTSYTLVVGPNAAATTWLQGNYAQKPLWGVVSVLEGIMNAKCPGGANATLDAPGVSYVNLGNVTEMDAVHRIAGIASAAACAQRCVAELNCNFFTYDPTAAACFFVPDTLQRNTNAGNAAVQSGARPGLCLYEAGVSYVEAGDQGLVSEDHRECCTRCRAEPNCTRWTFIGDDHPTGPGNGFCFLNPTAAVQTSSTSAVSGTPPHHGNPSLRHCPQVRYAPACADRMACIDLAPLPEAVALASSGAASEVVLVLGLDQFLESEGHDRATADLPANQYVVASRVASAARSRSAPVVGVFVHGGTFTLKNLKSDLDAALDAYYPGQQGGRAVADALYGVFSPAGRSTATFYSSNDDLPPNLAYQNLYANASQAFTGMTYRYYNAAAKRGAGPPDIWFGEGLSYTRVVVEFATVDLQVSGCDGITVNATVTNAGNVTSDYILPIYVQQSPRHGLPTPELRLGAFTRLKAIPAGGSVSTTLRIPPKFRATVVPSVTDPILGTAVKLMPGPVTIYVGGHTNPRRSDYNGGLLSTQVSGPDIDLSQC